MIVRFVLNKQFVFDIMLLVNVNGEKWWDTRHKTQDTARSINSLYEIQFLV